MTCPNEVPIIVRAFELAAESNSIRELRQKLRAEGYARVDEHLTGRLIRAQLNERMLPKGTSA